MVDKLYNKSPIRSSDQGLSRRELLKALTALGSAAAASSLLPDRWSKPEIGAGVLPVHAQSTCSGPYQIEDCDLDVGNDYPFYINSSVWILPPCPGVPMKFVWNYYEENENEIYIVNTDENGKATKNIPEITEPSIDIEWSFNNPADGTDTCSKFTRQ
jgi:hypothetical protein